MSLHKKKKRERRHSNTKPWFLARYSIRVRLTMTLIAMMAMVMLSSWLLNHFLLETYYINNVENNLKATYSKINTEINNAENEDEVGGLLNSMYTNYNIDIVVVSTTDGTWYSTGNTSNSRIESLMFFISLLQNEQKSEKESNSDWILGKPEDNSIARDKSDSTEDSQSDTPKSSDQEKNGITSGSVGDDPAFSDRIPKNVGGIGKSQIIETQTDEDENVKYIIQKDYDQHLQSAYFDLIGKLDNGYLIVLRTPLESIQQSTQISNKFMLYVMIVVTIIGSIFLSLFSTRFLRPIGKMAQIAKRMSELDFNIKAPCDRKDEVGELGHSMNIMSERLEGTISDLKTANNELKRDIAKKSEVDEMRTEFLSHVSHELKTPIALIQGYAEGLKDNINEDQESKEFYCDVIIDEADKMNIMVKKLLNLNEIESGSEAVKMERFDITEMFDNILSQADILLNQKEAVIENQLQQPLFVWADEFMIEEVINNYVTNAIHYVSEKGRIVIYSEQRDQEMRIFVHNQGSHIPEDELDKVWIKFYKVDKARTREYGGSGIGLSLVAATMQAHRKNYGVFNTEDGVTFYLDLDTQA